ncbi:MAG: hypothetical protein SFU56_15800 [Capsulimonadales bacterium]|nr:hypothetical protein [Capsulimonadales bacterium]
MKRWIGVLVLLLGWLPTVYGAPVGMVTHLTGKAEMRPASGSEWKPLRLMNRLEAGDSVRCGPDGEVILTVFATAEQCRVAAGTTVTLEAKGVKGAQKVTGLRGAGIQVARNMAGDRPNGFFARPAQAHQRLLPTYPGWLTEGERRFTWTPVAKAVSYTFTLFDSHDNIVWSQRVTAPASEYPADLPYFALRRPYVWRLVPFAESGKPLPESRWGVLTFLSAADAAQLTAQAREIEEQAKAADNVTHLVLLAELYAEYGALERTLEILERPELERQVGIREAQDDIYARISRYAQLLRTGSAPIGVASATP